MKSLSVSIHRGCRILAIAALVLCFLLAVPEAEAAVAALPADEAFIVDTDLNGSGDIVVRDFNGGTEIIASNNNPAVGERRIVVEFDITSLCTTEPVFFEYFIAQLVYPGAHQVEVIAGDGVVDLDDFGSAGTLVASFPGPTQLGITSIDVTAAVAAAAGAGEPFLAFRIKAFPNVGSIVIFTTEGSELFETFTPPQLASPVNGILEGLIADVQAAGLPRGVEQSLLAQLDGALRLLNDGNPGNDAGALNRLQAFRDRVLRQRGRRIPEAVADALIDSVDEVISVLFCE